MRGWTVVLGIFCGSITFPAVAQQFDSAAQIEQRVIGKTVRVGDDGRATYGRDGSYTYVPFKTGKVWKGRYAISHGQICVTFSGKGGRRCDWISNDGRVMYLSNMFGQRYEIR